MNRKLKEEEVERIKYLSKEEGLTDLKIAKELNCHRTTITRIRNRLGIETRNLNNVKDKTFICLNCNKEVFIKRCDNKRAFCDKCSESFK